MTPLAMLQEEVAGCNSCDRRAGCGQVVVGSGTVGPLMVVAIDFPVWAEATIPPHQINVPPNSLRSPRSAGTPLARQVYSIVIPVPP